MRDALLPAICELVGLSDSGAATVLLAITTISFLLIEMPLSVDGDRRNRARAAAHGALGSGPTTEQDPTHKEPS